MPASSEAGWAREVGDVNDLARGNRATFIYAVGVEERSDGALVGTSPAFDVFEIVERPLDDLAFEWAGMTVGLRDPAALDVFVSSVPTSQRVVLDITGFSHHVWAPLVRSLTAARLPFDVVYVEPGDYQWHPTPTEGTFFDLSLRIHGVRPIPGFASFGSDGSEDFVFVPILGFEGARFAHLLEVVQPVESRIVPVVGVPGFRLEFPFFAYLGNRRAFEVTKCYRRAQYARASDPFSLYRKLAEVKSQHPGAMKIAPIGTKPHSLGAVLFAIDNPEVELVYDNPVRKPGRSSGSDRIWVYPVSEFRQASSP